MNDNDKDMCRKILSALTSEKYKDKNFLFLQPFDLSQTPGYLDVVPKVMDLSTLSSNLESGNLYKTKDEFFADCCLIFENAIAYHGKRKETRWIAKFAKDMLKIAQRERKNVEKPEGVKTKPSGLLLPTKKNKKALEGGGTKLKLKLGGGSSSNVGGGAATPSGSAEGAVPTTTPPKPKMSIKLKGPSQGKQPPPASEQQQAAVAAAEAKKPRLTLKLGMNKAKEQVKEPEEATSTTPAASTPAAASSNSTPTSNKISLKAAGSAGSRGKELPKGVTPPKPETTKKTTKKSKVTATKSSAGTTKTKASSSKTSKSGVKSKTTIKTSASSSVVPAAASSPAPAPTPNRAMTLMTPPRKAQCAKVLNGYKRREHRTVGWFLQPVSDKNIVQDYKAKIPNPMDLSTMQTKLNDENDYGTISAFVLDLRRIFSNCLRYNTSIKDSLRPVAVQSLETVETLLVEFLAKPEAPSQAYPPLLFCWKLCINLLDTLYNMTDPGSGQMTAYYFLYPVSVYCGGQFPPDYLQTITKPMDYGTVTSNLIEGRYTSVSEFEADCKLVLENCITYYGGQPDGKFFTDQAARLKTVLQQQLDALNRYVKSSAGQAAQRQAQMATSAVSFPKPPIPLLLGILEEMRALKYTDKMTKITEPAMGPFEKPVSVASFPDYPQHVQQPMDLSTVEKNVKTGSYKTPEDFEYDMLLIFQNCIAYNSSRQADHLVTMAKHGMKNFKKIFLAKMKPFDDPTAANAAPTPTPSELGIRKDVPAGAPGQPGGKKLKVDTSANRSKPPAPRVTLSASTAAATAAPRPKAAPAPAPKSSVPKSKPGQPVPLHIAIAQVKEQFPLRRAVKTLQSWEAACARFFKELMRHTWISAARPKFIFHVPVPVLFPELSEAYAAKVQKPMDLTTVECALLAGNRYTSPEDFVNEVALVFSNAIIFNKEGRDVGDPLSCAYYDASIHLLRYCRWLSLELLSEYMDNSDHVDESEDPNLPPASWKLTEGNRKKAREEMEAIVLKEQIERSLEGDRFTWMEAECEKLLKALRHQSDLRQMSFFIQPNYPADYTAFIARPMDWEKVQKTLKKRQYDKFGDVIDDLRLIFSNALKYNARHAGVDSVSGMAYEAAKIMSAKLEAAINKMMITVSDRLERERIDHNIAEREIEAAERAEEERIRAQWKSENPGKEGGPNIPLRTESSSRLRTSRRTAAYRREQADFEVPFFDDEEDGGHETSYVEVIRQQKSIFERQRQERLKMQQTTCSLAAGLFMRLAQQESALEWVAAERAKLGMPSPAKAKGSPNEKTRKVAGGKGEESSVGAPSAVLKKLDEKNRTPFQFKLSKPKPKPKTTKKRKILPMADFGGDDSD